MKQKDYYLGNQKSKMSNQCLILMGHLKLVKLMNFFEEDINDLIGQMSQKRETFYLNDDI